VRLSSIRNALDLGFHVPKTAAVDSEPRATQPGGRIKVKANRYRIDKDSASTPQAEFSPNRRVKLLSCTVLASLIMAVVAMGVLFTRGRNPSSLIMPDFVPDSLIEVERVVMDDSEALLLRWAALLQRRDSLAATVETADTSDDSYAALWATEDTLSSVRDTLGMMTTAYPAAYTTDVQLSQTAGSSWARLGMGAAGAVVGVGLLAVIAAALRGLKNPLPWQLACWVLVSAGILSRQTLWPAGDKKNEPVESAELMRVSVPDTPPNNTADSAGTQQDTDGADKKSLLLSFVFGLALFPASMRRLNKLRPSPGLEHVARPFGLGFFVDLAQVATVSWVIPKVF
jgi:hypothetical protein